MCDVTSRQFIVRGLFKVHSEKTAFRRAHDELGTAAIELTLSDAVWLVLHKSQASREPQPEHFLVVQ